MASGAGQDREARAAAMEYRSGMHSTPGTRFVSDRISVIKTDSAPAVLTRAIYAGKWRSRIDTGA